MRDFLIAIVICEIVILLVVLRMWWRERKPKKHWRPDEPKFNDAQAFTEEVFKMQRTQEIPPPPPQTPIYKTKKE